MDFLCRLWRGHAYIVKAYKGLYRRRSLIFRDILAPSPVPAPGCRRKTPTPYSIPNRHSIPSCAEPRYVCLRPPTDRKTLLGGYCLAGIQETHHAVNDVIGNELPCFHNIRFFLPHDAFTQVENNTWRVFLDLPPFDKFASDGIKSFPRHRRGSQITPGIRPSRLTRLQRLFDHAISFYSSLSLTENVTGFRRPWV